VQKSNTTRGKNDFSFSAIVVIFPCAF